jgi:HK97 family phage major capsid protein
MAEAKRVTMEEFNAIVNKVVDERIKLLGLDRADIRHGIVPGATDEKAVRGMSREQRTIGFVRALLGKDFTRASVMSGGVGPEGGFLLPEEFRQDVIRQIQVIPVIRSQASVFPVSTMAGSVPKILNFVQTYWEGENSQLAATQFGTGAGNVQASQLLWRAWRLDGFMAASRELFDDAGFNVYNLFVQLFATAFRTAEDKAFTVGSGAGQPMGLRNLLPTLHQSANATPGPNTLLQGGVDQFVTQATIGANHMAYKDLINTLYLVQPQYRNGAVWLMHNQIVGVARNIVDSNGRPIWVEPTTFGDIAQGTPARLCGYPVLISMFLPTNIAYNSDTNTSEVWFGNLRWYYIFDRQQMAAETTIEGAGAFEKHQQILKVTQRVDGQPALADPFAVLQGAH